MQFECEAPAPEKRLRVLVLETSPGHGDFLRGLLECIAPARPGYSVEVQSEFEAGLAGLGDGQFDIVLLGMSAVDASELGLLRQVVRESRSLPVVALGDADEETTALEAVRGGAQDYQSYSATSARWLDRALRHAVERRRLTELRRQVVERYQAVLDGSPIAIIVVDEEQCVEAWNAAAEQIFGFGRQEVLGRPLPIVPEAEAHSFRQIWESAIRGEKTVGLETSRMRKDGTVLSVAISAAPLQDQFGRFCGCIALIADVTESQRTAAMLRSKTRQLEAIHDSLAVFLSRGDWHEAGRILLECALDQTGALFGLIGAVVAGPKLRISLEKGFVYRRPVDRVFCDRYLAEHRIRDYIELDKLDNLFGLPVIEGRPLLSNTAAGDPRATGLPEGHPPIESYLGVPCISGGTVVGSIGLANRPGGFTEENLATVQTLAELAGVLYENYLRAERNRALQTELREVEKLASVGTLAGGIAHEFNNVLTVILGETGLLMDDLEANSQFRSGLDRIWRSAERAAALTEQILAFSRKQLLRPRVVDLRALVSGLQARLQTALGSGLELRMTSENRPCMVSVDPNHFERALFHLADNAREACPAGGSFVIRIEPAGTGRQPATLHPELEPGSYVLLSATDTGCGMDETVLLRAFEPFFTTKGRAVATGMGLSSVHGIVKQSGGHVWLESTPGEGTTVWVALPRIGE